MGRRRQLRLAELAVERAADMLEANAPDVRLERERLREARRQAREADQRRSMLALGVALLVGGAASMTLPVVAAVGLGFVSAILVIWTLRAGADGFQLLLQRLGRPAAPKAFVAPPIAEEGLPDSRRTLTKAVVDDAAAEIARLEAAAGELSDRSAAEIIGRLAEAGRRLVSTVASRPAALPVAQRALTYHLPKAAMLAASLKELEATSPAHPRNAHIRLTLARIDNLFERTELELLAGGGADMDLELRLVNQALDEDLGGERPERR